LFFVNDHEDMIIGFFPLDLHLLLLVLFVGGGSSATTNRLTAQDVSFFHYHWPSASSTINSTRSISVNRFAFVLSKSTRRRGRASLVS
jgi:hypothetical protein